MSRSNHESFTPLVDPLDELPDEDPTPLIPSGLGRGRTLARHLLEHYIGEKNQNRISQEREQQLATIIQDGITAQEFLDKFRSEATAAEQEEYASQIRQLEASVVTGREAERELFECNINLADSFARRSMNIGKNPESSDSDDKLASARQKAPGAYSDIRGLRSPHASLEDRMQIAREGLLDAVRKFKPGHRTKHGTLTAFSTYATWRIHGVLSRFIPETEARGVRLAYNAYGEIANALKSPENFSAEKYDKLMFARRMSKATSFETIPQDTYAPEEATSWEEPQPLTTAELIADPNPSSQVDHNFYDEGLRDDLEAVLATLSEREAEVIRLRYGLVDGQPRALDEIGAIYGVKHGRVRQIENKALSALRHPSRSTRLAQYLDTDDIAHPSPHNRLDRVFGITNFHHQGLLQEFEDNEGFDAPSEASITPDRTGLESWQANADDSWDEPVFTPPTPNHEAVDRAEKLFVNILKNARPDEFAHISGEPTEPLVTIDTILTECSTHLKPHHIESYWNNNLEGFITKLKKANGPSFSLDKVSLLFSALLTQTMEDEDRVELAIPKALSGKLRFIGRALKHGNLIINGDVGDFAGYQLDDLASLRINGSVGHYAGAYASGMSHLHVDGDTGENFAFGATGNTTFKVTGEIESIAIMPNFKGEIITRNIRDKNSLALQDASSRIVFE